MFHTTRLSARSTSVYTVHSGTRRPRCGTWRLFPCVRIDDMQLYTHNVVATMWRLPFYDLRTASRQLYVHWMSTNRLKLNADKTELLWAGSRRGSALLGSAGPSLQLGTETVAASDQVCVLGMTLTSDLSLDKHVANVCATWFYWLRQIRQVRRSLDCHAGPRFRDVTRGLLQLHPCWGIQIHYRQAPVSYECHRLRWHSEVRPWTHQSTTRQAALSGPSSAAEVCKLCSTVHRCLQHTA